MVSNSFWSIRLWVRKHKRWNHDKRLTKVACQCWSRLSRNPHNRFIQQKVHRDTKVAHGQVHAARISAIRRVKRPMGDISPRIQWRTIKRRIQVRTTGTWWLLDTHLILYNIESLQRFNDFITKSEYSSWNTAWPRLKLWTIFAFDHNGASHNISWFNRLVTVKLLPFFTALLSSLLASVFNLLK